MAYRFLPGRTPTVVFLCGYASEMIGTKARFLHRVCADAGHAYLRFDYRGRGASSGRFEEGTIGSWTDDACAVIERAVRGPVVLVGSSMGGWIMLLVARRLPGRVQALVGVAAAPDFTEDGLWTRMSDSERHELATRGVLHVPSRYSDEPYPVTLCLVEDARERLQLRDRISLDCPVRLIHGYRDEDVPWQTSFRLAARLRSSDVKVEIRRRRGASALPGRGSRASRPDAPRSSWCPWYLTASSLASGTAHGAVAGTATSFAFRPRGAPNHERFRRTRSGRPRRSGPGRWPAPRTWGRCTRGAGSASRTSKRRWLGCRGSGPGWSSDRRRSLCRGPSSFSMPQGLRAASPGCGPRRPTCASRSIPRTRSSPSACAREPQPPNSAPRKSRPPVGAARGDVGFRVWGRAWSCPSRGAFPRDRTS